ncbi:hypothetical protein C8R44DRAFT_786882 [Mycena epipterygia]|nr:hypothetical protein C8R44DRAFT_786882 [Mycena epipterygia]
MRKQALHRVSTRAAATGPHFRVHLGGDLLDGSIVLFLFSLFNVASPRHGSADRHRRPEMARNLLLGANWVILAPLYIHTFFSQMGYFPLSGISVFEMDQIAALQVLGIAVVAASRSLRPIFKTVHVPANSHELEPMLPVSSAGTSSDR